MKKTQKKGVSVREEETLTGGVEAALTMKDCFRENPMGDWSDLGPRLCLADSDEKTRDEDGSRACAAMVVSAPFVALQLVQQKRVMLKMRSCC